MVETIKKQLLTIALLLILMQNLLNATTMTPIKAMVILFECY